MDDFIRRLPLIPNMILNVCRALVLLPRDVHLPDTRGHAHGAVNRRGHCWPAYAKVFARCHESVNAAPVGFTLLTATLYGLTRSGTVREVCTIPRKAS